MYVCACGGTYNSEASKQIHGKSGGCLKVINSALQSFTSSFLLSVTTNLSTIFSNGFRSLAGLSSSKHEESSVAQWG